MPIVTPEDLRNDAGWLPNARLRWLGITLQQQWVNASTGVTEWRDVPQVPHPTERG